MASIDPVALIGRGGTIKEPFPPESDVAARRFVDKWLKPGRSYRVLFGGAPSGTAVVREAPGDPGISLQSRVALNTTAPLGERTRAIAISETSALNGRPLQRRPLTTAERSALVAGAQSEFRKSGVSADAAKSSKIITASAINLDRSGRFELIARLQATEPAGSRCDLFVIAEPRGTAGYTLALSIVNKDKRTNTTEDTYYIEQDLVDAIDIDGDGIGEVVTRSVYYESHDYAIYKKRTGGKWRKVYRGAGGGV
jgi:hypothetical protein